MFDVDAERQALAVPELKVRGWVYRGRVLSEAEMAPFAPLGTTDLTLEERIDLEVALWRLVFRRPRWQFWKPDPVHLIRTMEWDVYQRFKTDFFACLAGRMNANENATAGTS